MGAVPVDSDMRTLDGRLDGFWVLGPELFALVATDPDAAVALFGHENLTRWAHLPCMDEVATLGHHLARPADLLIGPSGCPAAPTSL